MTAIAATSNTVSPDLLAAMNGAASTNSPAAGSTEETQNRFLTLLVTQMKNQDPLNPMDNAAVTSQMAQLSTVTGIDKLNTTLSALQGDYQSSQSLQASSLIGQGVLVPGSTVSLVNGAAVMGVELPADADSVTLTIRDGSGKTVRSMDLGAQATGTVPLTWNGLTDAGTTAANGAYTFEVKATNAGKAASADTLSYGQVGSVSTNAHGVKLNVAGVGAVDLDSVKQIL